MINTEALIEYARSMNQNAEAMRVLIGKNSVPAPMVYDVTGFAGATMDEFLKLFVQLADGLQLSLAEYDVHDENRHPAATVEIAIAGLDDCTLHATALADSLGRVQAAVNGQSYTTRRTEPAGLGCCPRCGTQLVPVDGELYGCPDGPHDVQPPRREDISAGAAVTRCQHCTAKLATYARHGWWALTASGNLALNGSNCYSSPDGRHVPSSETTGEPA